MLDTLANSGMCRGYAACTDLTETQMIDSNPTKAAARTSKMRSRKTLRVSCTLARISAKVTPLSIEICKQSGQMLCPRRLKSMACLLAPDFVRLRQHRRNICAAGVHTISESDLRLSCRHGAFALGFEMLKRNVQARFDTRHPLLMQRSMAWNCSIRLVLAGGTV